MYIATAVRAREAALDLARCPVSATRTIHFLYLLNYQHVTSIIILLLRIVAPPYVDNIPDERVQMFHSTMSKT